MQGIGFPPEASSSLKSAIPTPEALDGLGRAHWWLKDVRSAIETRTRAYRAYKKAERFSEAAEIAVWLARELRTLSHSFISHNGGSIAWS